MPHDDFGRFGDREMDGMGRARTLMDLQCSAGIVGDSSGVGSTGFTGFGQSPNHLCFLATGQGILVVDQIQTGSTLIVPPL